MKKSDLIKMCMAFLVSSMGTPFDHNSKVLLKEAERRRKQGALIISNYPVTEDKPDEI